MPTVLVVAAHPDDIESWCAGAVAALVRQGWRAVYVLCTSGEKGTSDPTESPDAVAARREAEQREACRRVGADEPHFLRLPDGGLEDDARLRGLLVRAIRREKPDLLLTHDPVQPWPPYTTHRDHRIAGRVALDAAYPYARDPLHFPSIYARGLLRMPSRRSGSSAPRPPITTSISPPRWTPRSPRGSRTRARRAILMRWQSRGDGAPPKLVAPVGWRWRRRSSG